jgi:excisionase family DNA binding protein
MHERQDKEKLAYTIPEVAELTGLSVSYLYRLSADGTLPVAKIGTRVIVISGDLNNWLREHSRANAIINQRRNRGGNQE